MGSLMAGWDSPVLMDPDTARLGRNKSLTREEIDSFWRLQGKADGEEGFDFEPPLSPSPKGEHKVSSLFFRKLEQSGGRPSANSPPESPSGGGSGRKESKTGDWWTRSNWAFLNEPPLEEVDESMKHKYAAQFHVAQIATK